jgi:hypothetical protein
MIKGVPWYLRLSKHLEIMNTTGPFMINRLANKNKQYISTLVISVPCDVCNIDKCDVNNSYYITPIQGSSWHSWDSALLNTIFCHKITFILLLILLILLIYSKKIKKNIKWQRV